MTSCRGIYSLCTLFRGIDRPRAHKLFFANKSGVLCYFQRRNGGKENFGSLMSEVLIIGLQGKKTKDVEPLRCHLHYCRYK